MFSTNGMHGGEGELALSSAPASSGTEREAFQLLARLLVGELAVDHAVISEFVDASKQKLRTLSLIVDGEPVKNLEYDLAGTPCEKVVRNGLLCYPAGVRQNFALDYIGPELGVESYAGIPVTDLLGRVLGVLAVMGRKPFFHSPQHLHLLQVYAGRAGARLEARQGLSRQRRRLRELESMVEGLPVPVFFQNPRGRFSGCNRAFLELFSLERDQVRGRSAHEFLDREQVAVLEKDNHVLLQQGQQHHVHEESLPVGKGRICEVVLKKSVIQRSGRFVGLAGAILDVSHHKRNETEIQQLAYYDDLTGLPNRALLKDRLDMALAEAERTKRQVGVLFFDLDRFKAVNDSSGHAFGDQLLEAIAGRLKRFVRKSDTLARLGGDEFVIVLSDVEGGKAVTVVAEKVLEAIGSPFRIQEREIRISTSIGIAVYPQDGRNGETLLKNADLAMYTAKELGRGRFAFCGQGAPAPVPPPPELEKGLSGALQQEDFSLHYQPMFDLSSGALTGFEALLRWRRGREEILTPERFVPQLEACGLMGELGEWVLRTACRQSRRWQEAGHRALRVTINVAASQLRQPGFGKSVAAILEETGVDPDGVELELPHAVLRERDAEVMGALAGLRDAGIRLTVDHFGLNSGPFDFPDHTLFRRIKIDRSHVRDIEQNPMNIEVVAAMVTLARTLKLDVAAVGVESRLQLEFLQSCNCASAQGFHLGRPLPGQEAEAAFLGPEARGRARPGRVWPG